jgi:hypothetical protein
MAKVTIDNGALGSVIRAALNAMFTELYQILTGKAGGQTIIGGTLTTQRLTLKANAANDTTGGVDVSSSLTSTSKTTGAFTVAGGMGVSGPAFLASTNVDEVKVSTVKVLGAQVAAIGLDAKADAAKITDIITALRAHGIIGPNA